MYFSHVFRSTDGKTILQGTVKGGRRQSRQKKRWKDQTIIFFKFLLFLSIPFFILVKNLVLINRRNGPRYQRVQALCAFFNRGGTKGTNSSKILCLMFCVCFVIFKVVSGLILCFFKGICGLMTRVESI